MPQAAAVRLFSPTEPATKAERLLLALARYQYLTSRQIVRVIGGQYADWMNRVLPPLENGGLIQRQKYGAAYATGQLPHVWYLTPAGVERAADMLAVPTESIYYHHDQRNGPGRLNYQHREHTIDVAIALDTWAAQRGVSVPMLETCENRGHRMVSGRKVAYRVTTIPTGRGGTVTPDMAFMAELRGKTRLFLLELHETPRMAHIASQLQRHLQLMTESGVQTRYGIEQAHILLSVHAHESTLALTKERMQALPDFQEFAPVVLFNTLDTIQADFGTGWHRADGSKSPVFGL